MRLPPSLPHHPLPSPPIALTLTTAGIAALIRSCCGRDTVAQNVAVRAFTVHLRNGFGELSGQRAQIVVRRQGSVVPRLIVEAHAHSEENVLFRLGEEVERIIMWDIRTNDLPVFGAGGAGGGAGVSPQAVNPQ